jgi:hypothetical protein
VRVPNTCQEVLRQWHMNYEERSLGDWALDFSYYLLCIIRLCEIGLVACLDSKCEDCAMSISSSYLFGSSSMNVSEGPKLACKIIHSQDWHMGS